MLLLFGFWLFLDAKVRDRWIRKNLTTGFTVSFKINLEFRYEKRKTRFQKNKRKIFDNSCKNANCMLI